MTDFVSRDNRLSTVAQLALDGYQRDFVSSTVGGAELIDLFRRSEVGAWRFERDRNFPKRWWINVTLPKAAAEMFDLSLEILVLYTELERLEPRTLSQVQVRLRTSVRVEPGVAIVVSKDPAVAQMANRRRGELSIVPVNLAEIQTDRRDLRKRIAAVISTIDHFDLTNPVRNPIGFFGRVREQDILRESLDRGQSVGIFGLRKAGKTSLMNSLEEQRREAQKLVVKLDVSEVSSADEFRLKLLQRTWESVHAHSQAPSRMPRLRLLASSGEARIDPPNIDLHWTDDLRLLLDSTDMRLELFVDEIDQAYPVRSTLGDEAERLFQTLTQLRGLVQEGTRVVLVCAGVDPALFEKALFGSKDNLLYKLVRLLWLSPMSRDEMAEMVRGLGKRMGVRTRSHEVIDRLFDEYGGHPLLTRKACSVAVRGRSPEELPYEISLDRLDRAIAERGIDSPQEQAHDVLRSFQEWFPAEAELLEWIVSNEPTERELALEETDLRPTALMHAVAYGLCDQTYKPRIRAAFEDH